MGGNGFHRACCCVDDEVRDCCYYSNRFPTDCALVTPCVCHNTWGLLPFQPGQFCGSVPLPSICGELAQGGIMNGVATPTSCAFVDISSFLLVTGVRPVFCYNPGDVVAAEWERAFGTVFEAQGVLCNYTGGTIGGYESGGGNWQWTRCVENTITHEFRFATINVRCLSYLMQPNFIEGRRKTSLEVSLYFGTSPIVDLELIETMPVEPFPTSPHGEGCVLGYEPSTIIIPNTGVRVCPPRPYQSGVWYAHCPADNFSLQLP